MIDASQRIITVGSSNEGIKGVPLRGMNPATKRRLELQIETLRNAPRDPRKVREPFKIKEKAEGGCNRERRHREIGNRI